MGVHDVFNVTGSDMGGGTFADGGPCNGTLGMDVEAEGWDVSAALFKMLKYHSPLDGESQPSRMAKAAAGGGAHQASLRRRLVRREVGRRTAILRPRPPWTAGSLCYNRPVLGSGEDSCPSHSIDRAACASAGG